MNSDVNELARAILKKPLEECTAGDLQQAAEQYPYFGPIQLLLAKKISASTDVDENNSASYEEQLQKASLYFQNRVWLHHLLNNDGNNNPDRPDPIVTGNEILSQPDEHNISVEIDKDQNTEDEIIRELPKEELIDQELAPVEVPESNLAPLEM